MGSTPERGHEVAALRERLGVGVDHLDPSELRRAEGDEAVDDPQDDLADDREVGGEEHVVGLVDAPLDGVLHRDDPEVDRPRLGEVEDLVDAHRRDGLHVPPELLEDRLLAVGAVLPLEAYRLACPSGYLVMAPARGRYHSSLIPPRKPLREPRAEGRRQMGSRLHSEGAT